MKKLLFLAVMMAALVLVGCAKQDSEENNTSKTLAQMGLKGPVKSVNMKSYEASMYFGKVKKGELISKPVENNFFSVHATEVWEFNRDGNIVQLLHSKKNGDIGGVIKYTYFKQNCVGIEKYGEDGELVMSYEIIMKNEKPVGIDVYNKKMQKFDSVTCEFDGFLISSLKYYAKGKVINTEENSYKDGLAISSTIMNQDGKTTLYRSCERNDAGQITKQFTRYDMDYEYLEEATYDEDNFCTHYVRSESLSGTQADYKFEYLSVDARGNWLKRVIYEDHQPIYIQERTIKYYE